MPPQVFPSFRIPGLFRLLILALLLAGSAQAGDPRIRPYGPRQAYSQAYSPSNRVVLELADRGRVIAGRPMKTRRRRAAEREPARARALQAKLRAWMDSITVEAPGPNPDFDPARQLLEVRIRPAAVTRR